MSTVVTFLSKKEKNLFCKHVCALCGPAVRGPLVQSVASGEPIKSSFPRPTTKLPLPDRCFPNSRGPRFWGVAEPIRFPFGGEGVASWVRLGAGFARLSRASLVAWRVVLLTPLHLFFSFSPPPPLPDRVLLISLWGCSWRRRSVGNDARSFNYRSRRTSVRKADRKKGRDRVKQEASPRHPSLSSQFGLEVRGNWKVSRIESGWGERPESYRLFAINFFWKPFSEPFLFIVDQPGRERESEEGARKRRLTRGNSCPARPGAPRAHTRAHSHPRAPSRAPSPPRFSGPRPRGQGLGRPRSEPVSRARQCPTRARLRDLLRVPERGYAIWTCNYQHGIWDFQKMKLATGLWVWVSLLVAAGTVQPSASQSGGSRSFSRFRGWPCGRRQSPAGDTLAPGRGGITPSAPLPWVSCDSLSVPKLTLCVCLCSVIVKNHSAPLFSFSLTRFFLARFLWASLSGIPSGGARCAGRGRPKAGVTGDAPLRVRAPREKKPRKSAPRPGPGKDGGPEAWQLGSGEREGCGESSSERAGFAPACAARGRCASGRPSLRGQTRLEPSLGAGTRREDAPRPGGPQR